jgi:hypothetical protein
VVLQLLVLLGGGGGEAWARESVSSFPRTLRLRDPLARAGSTERRCCSFDERPLPASLAFVLALDRTPQTWNSGPQGR